MEVLQCKLDSVDLISTQLNYLVCFVIRTKQWCHLYVTETISMQVVCSTVHNSAERRLLPCRGGIGFSIILRQIPYTWSAEPCICCIMLLKPSLCIHWLVVCLLYIMVPMFSQNKDAHVPYIHFIQEKASILVYVPQKLVQGENKNYQTRWSLIVTRSIPIENTLVV